MKVFALSFHADYRCEHSGVCCSSDWDVPVELPVFRTLEAALQNGLVAPVAPAYGGEPPLITGDDLPEGAAAMLARTDTGDCVFYHRHSGMCAVHRDAGESHLPSTCRHFPRLAVRDRRGTFITLTHYCPTAARSLFRPDCDTLVVESPPAFPSGDYEGLSVGEGDWPPLLHRTMLMDLQGYDAWERHMVARCAEPDRSPESIVATLRRDARLLCGYVPGAGSLTAAVASLPREPCSVGSPESLDAGLLLRRAVLSAIPDDLQPAADDVGLADAYHRYVASRWHEWQTPLARYIAAKAFANWTAYQGRGVLAIVRGIETALELVRIEVSRQCRDAARAIDADLLREAIRAADFMLNHLAVGEELADAWSNAEE